MHALRKLPVAQVAAGAGISERTVKRAHAGQTVHKDTRAKLTAYAIKHARVQLRGAGIRPPIDPEALLAAYLDRQPGRADAGEPELLCACGCGRPVKRGRRGPPSKWYSEACRKRAARRRAGHG